MYSLESRILGCIINNKAENIDTIFSSIKPEYFTGDINKRIFKLAKDLYNKGLSYEYKHLYEHALKNKEEQALLNEITHHSTEEAFDAGCHLYVSEDCRSLIMEAHRRELFKTLNNALEYISTNQEKDSLATSERILERIKSLSSSFIPDKESDSIGTVFGECISGVEHAKDYFKENHKKYIPGVRIGYRTIDELGILRPSNLVVIAGRPAMGKTAFALNIGERISFESDIPVGFISLEMDKQSIGMRLMSMRTSIDASKIYTGSINEDEFFRIREETPEFDKAKFYIHDSINPNIYKICHEIRSLKDKYDIKVVIIDYLQLIDINTRDNYQVKVAEISKRLKAIAKELRIPVIAISQMSRKSEERINKRPIMSDLRDSGQIEQDADVIIGLHRPGYYNKELPQDSTEVCILKNRHGKTMDIPFVFKLSTGKFLESSIL